MKKFIAATLFLILAAALPGFSQTAVSNAKIYEFKNGQWFDGKNFKRQTMYSVEGFFTKKKPSKIDETVDLQNGFVIPPLADAHTHNLDGNYNLEKIINDYLAEGTFYVQVLCNYATGAKQAKPFLNKPASLDVVYANGGLTSTLGHPFLAYEPRALGIYAPADWEKNMEKIKLSRIGENNAYWFFDSKSDVDAKWEKFLAQKPDLVKIFLLDAENHETKKNSGKAGDKGLSPEIAEYVVQKAHQAHLKVWAHIETANDFRLCLKIGVDGFAHAPNYGWNGKPESEPKDELTLADIKLAVKRKTFIIPTANIGRGEATDYEGYAPPVFNQDRFDRIVARQKEAFNFWLKNGVKIILGSDYYGKTTGIELWHLHDNKIFDNRTLLKIAVEDTPQAIFPNRKIGRLKEGYEASFIVLQENPLANFDALKKITRRFKQGFFIASPKPVN